MATTSDLHFESAGTGSSAVVLVHAGIANLHQWDRVFAQLAASHRVLRYDVRGFGRSPDPVDDYYDHDDLIGVLDAAGFSRAVLVGSSNGGRIVLDAAATTPDRVAGMMLVNTALPGTDWPAATRAGFDAEDEALEAGDFAAARDVNLSMFVDGVGRHPGTVDPAVRAAVASWLDDLLPRQVEQARSGRGEAQLVEPLVRDRLREIDVPALVVIGTNDVAGFDGIARKLADELPSAELVEIDGAAHLPNLEQPEQFMRLLTMFVRRVGG